MRSRCVTVAAGLVLLVLATPSPSQAWDWDYKWDTNEVGYQINPTNKSVSPERAVTAIRRAARAWTDQSEAAFRFRYLGKTSQTSIGKDGKNIVLFRNTTNGGALATCYYWYRNKRLVDADVVFYESKNHFSDGTRTCKGEQYIEGVAIHELGHALGLKHSSEPGAVMWPSSTACSRSGFSLHADDRAGVQDIYPCSSDFQCRDDDVCTTDRCVSGRCKHWNQWYCWDPQSINNSHCLESMEQAAVNFFPKRDSYAGWGWFGGKGPSMLVHRDSELQLWQVQNSSIMQKYPLLETHGPVAKFPRWAVTFIGAARLLNKPTSEMHWRQILLRDSRMGYALEIVGMDRNRSVLWRWVKRPDGTKLHIRPEKYQIIGLARIFDDPYYDLVVKEWATKRYRVFNLVNGVSKGAVYLKNWSGANAFQQPQGHSIVGVGSFLRHGDHEVLHRQGNYLRTAWFKDRRQESIRYLKTKSGARWTLKTTDKVLGAVDVIGGGQFNQVLIRRNKRLLAYPVEWGVVKSPILLADCINW